MLAYRFSLHLIALLEHAGYSEFDSFMEVTIINMNRYILFFYFGWTDDRLYCIDLSAYSKTCLYSQFEGTCIEKFVKTYFPLGD